MTVTFAAKHFGLPRGGPSAVTPAGRAALTWRLGLVPSWEVTMATATTPQRRHTSSRQSGYLATALINGALIYLLLVEPGWESVPFLTAETPEVLGLVTLTMATTVAFNLLYLAADPAWLTALGGFVTTAIGLASLVRIWQVFPFDFADSTTDWAQLTRMVLALGMIGSAIGLIVYLSTLVGLLSGLKRNTVAGRPGPG